VIAVSPAERISEKTVRPGASNTQPHLVNDMEQAMTMHNPVYTTIDKKPSPAPWADSSCSFVIQPVPPRQVGLALSPVPSLTWPATLFGDVA
jgi:hypothetical protein